MKSKKVILDTNLWISFLISNKMNVIDDLLITGEVRLIFSKELLDEFLTVSERPKFKKYFSKQNLSRLIELFEEYGDLVEVNSSTDICRDSKDNFLLDLALDSKANYLVTGDSDLLVVKKINKTKIIRWTDFIEEIKKTPS